jgi:MFS family permease
MADRFVEAEAVGVAQLRQQEHDLFVQGKNTSSYDVDNPIHGVFEDWEKSTDRMNPPTTSFTGIMKPGEDEDEKLIPDMWSYHYIGLYCQYGAIGLLYGTSGALLSLCVYVYDGSPNLCANAQNIMFFAWSFKIIFAIITDIYRPFGMRRKPWMILGWSITLLLLFILAIIADKLTASTWLVVLLFTQFFAMFSDVPADGYSVELGQLEPKHRRGQILATGQMVRFSFCILAGFIQAIFMNGPSTNEDGCQISFTGCWSFGLTINQYYALLFVIVFFLCIPILCLKELDASHIPQHKLSHFTHEIWETLQNLTTFYILIFIIGVASLTNFKSVVNTYMQYYVIELNNFQAGIDTITTYIALAAAIWVFKSYLLNADWRRTQYVSTIGASMLGFVWILVFYNTGGLRDGWFTIFIDLDQVSSWTDDGKSII